MIKVVLSFTVSKRKRLKKPDKIEHKDIFSKEKSVVLK